MQAKLLLLNRLRTSILLQSQAFNPFFFVPRVSEASAFPFISKWIATLRPCVPNHVSPIATLASRANFRSNEDRDRIRPRTKPICSPYGHKLNFAV